MGFLSGIFGGGGSTSGSMSEAELINAQDAATRLTAQTPEEKALLAKLSGQIEGVDQGVIDEMAALRARGEDLNNVDANYMERAYRPAFERLMNDYQVADRGVMEDLNARGIAAIPGGQSEQEAYQRMLLSRDTKENMGRAVLEAQNQAVNQKLGQYNARLAEVGQANTRRGQVFDPYYNATVVPESERQANRVNAAGDIYNAKLGYAANVHQTNTNRKIAGSQQMTDMGAAGAGVAAAGIMAMSDVNVKKDFEPANPPEQDLDELNSIPVARWRYQMEGEGEPMHTGGMAQDMPPDVSPDGQSVDVVSYLGKTTQAIQALTKKMNAFEALLGQGGQA
jgi:hypothetical protein